MKNLIAACLLIQVSLPAPGQVKDTFEVHFPINNSKLSKEAANYIDRLIYNDKLIHGDKLMVLGYADFVGGSGYNDTLSLMRATGVRDYLVSLGLDKNDIKLCVGKGKIDRANINAKDGYAPDRKVQIVIDREAMANKELLNSSPAGSPQGPANNDGKIDLDNLEVNQTFALNNIFFKLNSPVILEKSEPDLQRLLGFLNRYPSVKVQIEGHVCCMGVTEGVDSKYKGRNLSESRAEAVYNYLVEKGIGRERLKFAGLANTNPVVKPELTEEDRQKNRRVEVRILSK